MDDKKGKVESLLTELRSKRLPIVTLDTRWHEMFAGIDKPRRVKDLEEEVNELLKRQGQVNTEIKEVKKLKAKLMQSVVDNMETSTADEGLNKKRSKILEKNQKLILECNDKLDDLTDESFDIPDKLKKANEKLVLAGMEVAYKNLQKGKRDYEAVSAWIEEARAELRKQLLVKQDLEDKNTMIYTNMHDVFGQGIMELLDNIFG